MIPVLLFIMLVFGVQAPADAADSRGVYPLTVLKSQCIDFSEVKIGTKEWEAATCAVTAFDSFGRVDNETYYYGLYCLIPNHSRDTEQCGSGKYYSTRGSAVFVQQGADKARLLFERASSEIGIYVYDEPEIVESTAGIILALTIRFDGTGNGNASEYYLRKKGAWQRIESETWAEDLRKKIPAGLEIWKGVWIDLETMTAKAGLYRKGDGNCCPTGGEAHVQVAVENDRFEVKSVKIEQRGHANKF